MILVDTGIWIDHFRHADAQLAGWLTEMQVLGHPFVQGELACGQLRDRAEVLTLFDQLPQAQVIHHASVLKLVDFARAAGSGLGWVDMHLLASTIASQAAIYTRDRDLALVARRLHVTVHT
jgi:hypothetical protein